MKKLFALSLVALFSVSVLANDASAAKKKFNVNERQQNQKSRIKHGVKTGELTRKESKHLIQGQRKIARTEARFKSDGNFTKRERAKVHALQTKQSQKIFVQKHDKQDRN